jgi:hypothetical protein
MLELVDSWLSQYDPTGQQAPPPHLAVSGGQTAYVRAQPGASTFFGVRLVSTPSGPVTRVISADTNPTVACITARVAAKLLEKNMVKGKV